MPAIAGAVYEQQIELKKLFHKFDLNGNGALEPPEFKAAIESVGYNLSTEQALPLSPPRLPPPSARRCREQGGVLRG